MPKLILFFAFVFALACSPSSKKSEVSVDLVASPLSANKNAKKVDLPKIELIETIFDFGELKQGESVTHSFILKNIGSAPLLISAAKGSCGCTVPQWPKKPILEGEQAEIKVTFDSSGKSGMQNKTVTLVTNAIPNTKVITIKGNVIIPENK